MFSPALQSQLIQTRIDDLSREASAGSRRGSLRRRPLFGGGAVITHSSSNDRRSTYRFLRHYAEMVVVMFAGMFVLMAPAGVLFSAFGTSWSRLSPAMNVFAMALTMTVPMVAWMRYRGHTWRANVEMAASMLIPTFAVMVMLWGRRRKGHSDGARARGDALLHARGDAAPPRRVLRRRARPRRGSACGRRRSLSAAA